jgi:hypothetical protein
MNNDDNQGRESEETDNLAEYLEYLARMIPTTLPEWMD